MLAIQDRTVEFQRAVGTFGRQLGVKPLDDSRGPIASSINNKTKVGEFTQRASAIASDIVKVTGTLKKLAQLARRKDMINDKPSEVVELTYVIKQEIFRIEKELKQLSRSTKSGGQQEVETYNKNVVTLLNTKTKNISENFKTVLEERQKSEMMRKARHEQLIASVSSENGSVPYALRNKVSDNPFMESSTPTGDNDDPPELSLGDLTLPDQTQQLLLLEEQQNQYVQERSNAVKAIESTINEVGGLFQQLATMVQEQGEMIQRIDDNIEDVGLNISGAHTELEKYYKSVSSNRWLILQVFAIIIVFFLVWVLVS